MRRHAMTREQAFKALELHAGASLQEIKQAYRDLALVWHPDRFVHHGIRLQEKASERFKEINTAYDVLRSYDDGPSRAHEPRTKHTGSNHGASGKEQSGTQRQNSPKPSTKHTESLLRPGVVFAALIFVVVIAGLLNDRPTGEKPFDPLDHQGSRDSLQREPIDLLSLSGEDSRPQGKANDLLQSYRPTTRPDEVGSPAADTVASSSVELGTGSTTAVFAVPEPGADASGSSSLYFTQGSHRDDVLRIQGTPSSINRYSDHEVWRYGFSTIDISLRDGCVTEWSNTGNLKVKMDAGPNVTGDGTFTRGSHRDDVLRIQGTPSSINRYSDHEVWRYGFSTIDISLRDGCVTEWSNRGNLKVRMDAGTQ